MGAFKILKYFAIMLTVFKTAGGVLGM
jgi:hypothetical protein